VIAILGGIVGLLAALDASTWLLVLVVLVMLALAIAFGWTLQKERR
jgi:hypothetical protein